MTRPKTFCYSLNQNLRRIVKWIMRSVTVRSTEKHLDIHTEEIKEILVVRATFRMACALGTRAVAIFQHASFDHCGPPPGLGRVVYQPKGCSPEEVLDAYLAELSPNTDPRVGLCEIFSKPAPLSSAH